MSFLDHVRGPELLALLCLLVFVEECGVPVPFAPGDVLLVACGLAIRAGDLNPAVALAAVYASTLAGAAAGREVFELGGARLLGPTRLRGSLDRAARLLARGGWPAVAALRLTPGLRVTTTEVAGLLRVPRRTFLSGLVPAAALYVAAFVGAGMLFGRPAVALLLGVVHRAGLGVAAALAVGVSLGLLWVAVRVLGEGGQRWSRRPDGRRA
jgi:membrane-associated protein